MTSAAFCAFIGLPVIIDRPGQYVTRCGEVVTVEAVSTRHDYGCRGNYSNGVAEGWHKSGRLYFGQECQNDIVSIAPGQEGRCYFNGDGMLCNADGTRSIFDDVDQ